MVKGVETLSGTGEGKVEPRRMKRQASLFAKAFLNLSAGSLLTIQLQPEKAEDH